MAWLLATLALGPAWAGTPGVAVGGGFDYGAGEPWTGAEVAYHTLGSTGWAPHARLSGGWFFDSRQPFGSAEGGLLAPIPGPETQTAVVRLGLIGRLTGYTHPHPPIRFGSRDAEQRFGLVPAVLVALELEWNEVKHPFAVGLRAGGGSAFQSCAEDVDPAIGCQWFGALVGGAWARWWLGRTVLLEASVGPDMTLRAGWVF